MKTAAFLGTGNMGSALIRAACRVLDPAQVIITNPTAEKAAALAEELGCTVVNSNAEAVQAAKYVFLCVKPQVMHSMLQALAPSLRKENVLISIAAGIPLADLQADLPRPLPLLRVMPNTCAAIGQGMLALSAAEGVEAVHLAAVEHILSDAGRITRMDESQIDAFTALAGCGPAFVDLFVEALADGGVMAGLPRAQALLYATQTVLGSAAMILESGTHPAVLKDAVCSPGGSTIAGVATLEAHGFRSATIEAVQAAYRRNLELGQR